MLSFEIYGHARLPVFLCVAPAPAPKGSGVLFLLYGPPGTGKTLAVEALAARFARPLYSLSFAELGSVWGLGCRAWGVG